MVEIITPPEAETFFSLKEAEEFIYQHAFDHGYALTRTDKRPDKKGNIRRWDFGCDKGGRHHVQGGVKRHTKTRTTGCTFELRIHRVLDSGDFKLEIKQPVHNHGASDDPRQHPQNRRPTSRETRVITNLSASGVAPRFILNNLLARDPETLVTAKEITNTIEYERQKKLNGRLPIEALVEDLDEDENWALHYTTNHQGRVNFFFFAPDAMISLAQSSPEVLLIDATYKVNKYNMPCIHFMTTTSIGRTASVALAFVASEEEAYYNLAVSTFRELVMGDARVEVILTDDEDALRNALDVVYPDVPQLLCLWHVNKNVQTYVNTLWYTNVGLLTAGKEFMADWEAVVYAKTVPEFDARYALLRTKYAPQTRVLNKIHENKFPKRHLFAKPWTSKFRHLGHTVTSRAESGHSKLKQWLLHRRHDLYEVKARWESMTKNFITEHQMELARERDRVSHELRVTRWNPVNEDTREVIELIDPALNQEIVDRALKLFVQQLTFGRDEVIYNAACTGCFEAIYGIPCYHTLRSMRTYKRTVRKEDFHRHWHFHRDGAIPLPPPPAPPAARIIYPPNKVVTRGRPRADRSTRRNPSAFETSTLIGPPPAPRLGRLGGQISTARSTPAGAPLEQPPAPGSALALTTLAASQRSAPRATQPPPAAPANLTQQAADIQAQMAQLQAQLQEIQAQQAEGVTQSREGEEQAVQQQWAQEQVAQQPIATAPRKRGRPKGSKDKQPRRKKVKPTEHAE
jgi:MULE transposase domain